MEKLSETNVSTTVFELLADDGWPEDAGWWPLGGCTLPSAKCFREHLRVVRFLSIRQGIISLMKSGNRVVVRRFGGYAE